MLSRFQDWLQDNPTTQNIGSGLVIAATVVGTVVSLYKINKWKKTIEDETQSTLKETSRYALGSLAIASIPSLIVRLSRENSEIFYTLLISNRWVRYSFLIGTLTLTGTAYFMPKEKKGAKHATWAASCLSLGVLLGPAAFLPPKFTTLAVQYTAALTIPLLSIASFANNRQFFFLGSSVLMTTTTLAVAEVNRDRHGRIVYLPLIVVFTNGVLQIWNMNNVISQVEHKENIFGEKTEPDEIALAMQISSFAIKTYLDILIQALRFLWRRFLKPISPKKKKRSKK